MSTLNPLGEVHLSAEWVARVEGISLSHCRRLLRQGAYPGAYKRAATGAWLVPMSSVTRTLDGTIQEWLRQPA